MVGSVAGKHRSPHRGSSVEFAEYRDYVPGDDLRRLDWRAYGRSDRFFIKEFEADTNLRLILVVDASGSMKYAGQQGTGPISKYRYAAGMAAVLTQIALRQGDAAGLRIAATEGAVEVPPRRKPSHLRVIVEALDRASPAGPTRLTETLHEAADRVQRRALFCIFSDFFVQPDALSDAFQHLRFRNHDVAAFHLFDRDEIDFGFKKPTRFVDPEGGGSVLADPSVIASRYLAALARYRSAIESMVVAADLDYREVFLDDDPAEILSNFLVGRAGKRTRA